ncbi:MAG: twin-arginine translocase subunit TatC [Chthoniobacterales bacterium]|nr:twin-arginine translocase subunit TatC [Chthoniobacterales bacterium]
MSLKTFFNFRNSRDEEKSFLAHLEDLRMMLIKICVALAVTMTLCFVFRSELAALVQRPLDAVEPTLSANLQSLGVADSFTISLELAFYGGIVLGFPFILFFLAEFVLPALTVTERHMLYPVALAGFGLFLGGVAFCYFVVLPQTLEFFFKDAQAMGWHPTWRVREYYSFTTQFLIGFGLAFELPLVVLVLVKLGIVDYAFLARTRAFALVIIFIVAAVITPTTDLVTLVLMGGPMYVLYEICIAISWLMRDRGGE